MNKIFENYKKLADQMLTKYNPVRPNLQKVIYEAMNYSLSAGGKRLRPALLMEFNRIFGGDANAALPFACALEYIHTYSLIHDDLPAMDNDDMRRGKPTCHKVYGEANAVLAGDALLTKAFELMAECDFDDKARQLRAIACIAESVGTEGMIGGQVIDIQSENKSIPYETLKTLHSLKTGALIKAACVGGAILGGASEREISKVSDYAVNLGIAFQIRDDILDVIGSAEELGKPIGSDSESCKNTYVSLFGLEKSEELCREYTEKAISALDNLPDTENLKLLAEEMVNRTY